MLKGINVLVGKIHVNEKDFLNIRVVQNNQFGNNGLHRRIILKQVVVMEEEILNAQEASEYLKISKSYLLKMAKEKRLPSLRIGRIYRFTK